jgi:hypothetical protein
MAAGDFSDLAGVPGADQRRRSEPQNSTGYPGSSDPLKPSKSMPVRAQSHNGDDRILFPPVARGSKVFRKFTGVASDYRISVTGNLQDK